jgi:hypothetical protein
LAVKNWAIKMMGMMLLGLGLLAPASLQGACTADSFEPNDVSANAKAIGQLLSVGANFHASDTADWYWEDVNHVLATFQIQCDNPYVQYSVWESGSSSTVPLTVTTGTYVYTTAYTVHFFGLFIKAEPLPGILDCNYTLVSNAGHLYTKTVTPTLRATYGSATATKTDWPTRSATVTPTASATRTATNTATFDPSNGSRTMTGTRTKTETVTASATHTPVGSGGSSTITQTQSPTTTQTVTATPSFDASYGSRTMTATRTRTETVTCTQSFTSGGSVLTSTTTQTVTATPSFDASYGSRTMTGTRTKTETVTASATNTPGNSTVSTSTATPTVGMPALCCVPQATLAVSLPIVIGLAVDEAAGRIYATHGTSGSDIRIYDLNGALQGSFASGLSDAYGLVLEADKQHLWVANSQNQTLQRFAIGAAMPDITLPIGSDSGKSYPHDVSVDSAGNVYAVINTLLVKYSKTGASTYAYAGLDLGGLYNESVHHAKGRLYVGHAYVGGSSVRVFDAATLSELSGSPLASGSGGVAAGIQSQAGKFYAAFSGGGYAVYAESGLGIAGSPLAWTQVQACSGFMEAKALALLPSQGRLLLTQKFGGKLLAFSACSPATPTATPSVAAGTGQGRVLAASLAPVVVRANGRSRLYVRCSEIVNRVTVKLYTSSGVLVSQTQFGPQPKGWSWVPLPSSFVQGNANGYYRLAVTGDGQTRPVTAHMVLIR